LFATSALLGAIQTLEIDKKSALILLIESRGLFLHFRDTRKPGSAFEDGTQVGMLLGRADGKHFHAAVTEISDEAAESQLLRGILREVAKAYTLNHSGHEIPLRLSFFAHNPRKL
jgi:hypothetical protein